jgi:hypothetical protein
MDPNCPAAFDLAAGRPNAVSAAEKESLRKSLPPSGEVLVTRARDVEKLSSVISMLRFFERDAIYDVKVVDVPEARAGLYGRAYLLISLPMLRLLDKEELAAIAAHEAGHEYVWDAFEDARAKKDKARLRQLELTCDAIAGMALTSLGIRGDRLSSGLERASTYNVLRFGFSLNQDSYPTLKERQRVSRGARLPVGLRAPGSGENNCMNRSTTTEARGVSMRSALPWFRP